MRRVRRCGHVLTLVSGQGLMLVDGVRLLTYDDPCPTRAVPAARLEIAMRIVTALVLSAHGVAHLVGFVVLWRLAVLPDVPYRSTILGGRLEVGDAGVKALGVLWLTAALAFVAAAAGVLLHVSWWRPFTMAMALVSLALCVTGWPDTKLGIPVNIVIIVLLVVGSRAGWPLMAR